MCGPLLFLSVPGPRFAALRPAVLAGGMVFTVMKGFRALP